MATSSLGFHEGSMLYRAAQTYPTLLEVITESVQNGIDKGAGAVHITINTKNRNISIRDNGEGVDEEEFEEALQSVGKSIKERGKLGRFGLGLISPFGKCECFTFTSTPKSNSRGYTEWRFVFGELKDMHDVRIPMKPRRNLQYGSRGGRGVSAANWRTQVLIENYTRDRFISRFSLESLADAISERFNDSMLRNGTKVHITVKNGSGPAQQRTVEPQDYDGIPLSDVVISNKDGGDTHIRMFLSKSAKGRPRGRVKMGETDNDFRILFSTFRKYLPPECRLDEECVRALESGIFEGEILTSRAEFESHRKGFKIGDSLVGLCAAIEEWFEQDGFGHFKEASEVNRNVRYQTLGVRSLRAIEAVVKSSEDLLRVIRSFERGHRGSGHFPVKGKDMEETTVAIHGGEGVGKSGQGSGESPERVRAKKPKSEHEQHTPYAAGGPRGQQRKLVRNGSFGLILLHEIMRGDELWNLDTENGIIRFNIRHPLWVMCDERSDTVLMKFQEYIILQALMLECVPEDWREQTKMSVELTYEPYALLLTKGEKAAGRLPGRKSRTPKVKKKPTKLLELKTT